MNRSSSNSGTDGRSPSPRATSARRRPPRPPNGPHSLPPASSPRSSARSGPASFGHTETSCQRRPERNTHPPIRVPFVLTVSSLTVGSLLILLRWASLHVEAAGPPHCDGDTSGSRHVRPDMAAANVGGRRGRRPKLNDVRTESDQCAPTPPHRSVTDSSSGMDVPKQFALALNSIRSAARSSSSAACTSDRPRCLKIAV